MGAVREVARFCCGSPARLKRLVVVAAVIFLVALLIQALLPQVDQPRLTPKKKVSKSALVSPSPSQLPDLSNQRLSDKWRRVVDDAVEALWQQAPKQTLFIELSPPYDADERDMPPDFQRRVQRVIQYIDGEIYYDPRGWQEQLPHWERIRLNNFMLLISLAHKRGTHFPNFELVATGSDCPCEWTHCFCTVTCGTDHPLQEHVNPPYPQWFDERDGPLLNVDRRVSEYVAHARSIDWAQRASVAVFRGVMSHMTTIRGLPGDPFSLWLDLDTWPNYARGKLLSLRQEANASAYLNVYVDAGTADKIGIKHWGQTIAGLKVDEPKHMSMLDQARRFKYSIYAEGSCGWADRLKWLLALGLVPFLQETRCVEWYTLMLEPWVHYIPVDGQLKNLTAAIRWARENDEAVRQMSAAIVEFANIISRAGMLYHTERLLLAYTRRLSENNRPSSPLPHMKRWEAWGKEHRARM